MVGMQPAGPVWRSLSPRPRCESLTAIMNMGCQYYVLLGDIGNKIFGYLSTTILYQIHSMLYDVGTGQRHGNHGDSISR